MKTVLQCFPRVGRGHTIPPATRPTAAQTRTGARQVLLRIDSSPRANSATRLLTSAYAQRWQEVHPGQEVRRHDLAVLNPPHLNAPEMGAWFDDPSTYTELHSLILARSNNLIDDVLDAEELVIGAPMWNFSIPSSLKAWLDHIVRVGRTIQPTDTGLEGIVPARRAVVLTASGSDYTVESPLATLNAVGPYMVQILTFLGIDEVRVLHAHCQGPHYPDAAEHLDRARAEAVALASNTLDLTTEEQTIHSTLEAIDNADALT
jgi:FMN-dependent NADH-azoreductase